MACKIFENRIVNQSEKPDETICVILPFYSIKSKIKFNIKIVPTISKAINVLINIKQNKNMLKPAG